MALEQLDRRSERPGLQRKRISDIESDPPKWEMACVNVKKYSTDQKQVCYNCGQMEQGRCRIRCYSTFDEENRAECIRRAELSFEERWREFAALQARVFGKAWTETPMVRQIRVERLNWY